MKFPLIIILLSFLSLKGQTNIDFNKGLWLVMVKEKDLVAKDTITLIKIASYVVSDKNYEKINVNFDYGNRNDNTDLYFRENGILYVNPFTITCGCRKSVHWKWRYVPATEILNIDIAGKQKNRFKLLEVKRSKEQWDCKIPNENSKIVNVEGDIEKYTFVKQK